MGGSESKVEPKIETNGDSEYQQNLNEIEFGCSVSRFDCFRRGKQ